MGLRGVSDYVHSLGMQFGLWFEFSRVDLRTANKGLHPWTPDMLLHQKGQSYRSWCQHVYMMCTGATGAADWALENMAWCVREFDLDYIKIDDNEWAVCDDTTHGHEAGDGEWHQIQGVYHILRGLRERFPNLVIENCAGGSQRSDLGMARYCVPIQVHDRCTPSILERRYCHAFGCIYPQFAPLVAFAPAPTSVAQLRWRAFSRMMGQFNSGIQEQLSPELYEEMKRCIVTYKRLRPTLHGDRYVLAEPAIVLEPDVPEATNWEAYQYLSPDSSLVSLFCFRCESPDDSYRAVLKGLQADASYRVSSHGGGDLGAQTGAQLMRDGIVCTLPGRRNAEVFILTLL
jgi:alpha-galactosidase